MITEKQKIEIISLVDSEKNRLGSYAKVATKCGISETTMSQLRSQTYKAEGDDIYLKIAGALGYNLNPTTWQIVETSNTRLIFTLLDNAKKRALFLAISHRAGSGKSASTKAYETANKANGVFRLECREWSRREFLFKICQLLGIDAERKLSTSVDGMIGNIAEFFNNRAASRPLLILDEADKLKDSAIRTLIPLYNECESNLGLLICGCDNLQKEFQNGVRGNKKGYDELMSRFGRKFIHLPGATQEDVKKICEANGIAGAKQHKSIFEECAPVNIMLNNQQMKVVHDIREVRRKIEREFITLKQNRTEAATA